MNLELLTAFLTVGVFAMFILAVIAYKRSEKKLSKSIDNYTDLGKDNDELYAAKCQLLEENDKLQRRVDLNHRDAQIGRSLQEVMDWMYNPETPLEKIGIFGDFVRHKGLGSALDFFNNGAILTPEMRSVRGLEATAEPRPSCRHPLDMD